MLRLDWVTFDGDAESVDALYVNKKLFIWGDYYHSKTEYLITGYLMGANDYSMEGILFYKYSISDEEPICLKILEDGDSPPLEFKNLPTEHLVHDKSVEMPLRKGSK